MKSSLKLGPIQIAFMAVCLIFINEHKTFAQENVFSIAAQYRARPEYRSGYKALLADSTKPAFFVGQRARLIFNYQNELMNSKISIQDSRTWGDEEQKKDFGGLQVNELWFDVKLNSSWSVKTGRQELVYDDHRLLGNLDWANLTISHDALVIKNENKEKGMFLHVGGAYNESGEPLIKTKYVLKNYKYLWFVWLKKDIKKWNSNLSVLFIENAMQSIVPSSTSLRSSFTFGPIYSFQNKKWKANLGGYYQTGKTESNLNLYAYMLNAYIGFQTKLTAGLGLDYLSGNTDNTHPKSSNTFTTLYATNHKFYGYMDYFTNIPSDTKSRGLVDSYVKLGYKTSEKTALFINAHYFMLANENNTGPTKIKKELGTELDLIFDYKANSTVSLQLGYSILFAEKSMEYLKGGNKNNYTGWAFASLLITPTLFKHELKSKQ